MSSIPLDNPDKFDIWMRERWVEKDALLEQYISTGRFPAHELPSSKENGDTTKNSPGGFIETEVKPKYWWEVFQIFTILLICALVTNMGAKVWNLAFYGNTLGKLVRIPQVQTDSVG